ncbi:MAG: sulfur oxidation c-type cytochrome SoxX [Gammaproteobacteria bacterium]|nr:sulfur oxidation c-type cytochrome SoxX [Gammaproteobacteria bacterium]
MYQTKKLVTTRALLLLILGGPCALPAVASDGATLKLGQEVSFDSAKGNCLACHMIPGGESPGNIGPPLIAMKARFPERAVLRAQIWDATVRNPDSIMLPFGKHGVLSNDELDAVVDFLYTL